MNRISFSGSSEVIEDFAERFLERSPAPFEPLEETAERYGEVLSGIAETHRVPLVHLEKVVDFLVMHDVPEEEIDRLLTGEVEELAGLARDAGILEKYVGDGTIIKFSVTGEIGC